MPTGTSRLSFRPRPRSGWQSVVTTGLYGARPLGRVIQEHIKKPLAEELLFGKLVKGGAVKVTLKDNKLDFEITEAPLPALPKPEGDDEGGAGREEEVEV